MRCWTEPDIRQDVAATFAREFELAGTLAPGDALLHAWLPQPTLLFTQRDTRAAGYAQASEEASALGYAPVVRVSGGEAVPLDGGTVCVDLLLPGEALPLRGAFNALAQAITAAVAHLGLTASVGRVAGAYCPGDYDIAVSGRKFAGLAQRRTQKAIAAHSFVLVAGPGRPRFELATRIAATLSGATAPAAVPSAATSPATTPQSVATLPAAPSPAASVPPAATRQPTATRPGGTPAPGPAPCPVTSLAEAAGRDLRAADLLAAIEAVWG